MKALEKHLALPLPFFSSEMSSSKLPSFPFKEAITSPLLKSILGFPGQAHLDYVLLENLAFPLLFTLYYSHYPLLFGGVVNLGSEGP